MNRLMIPSPEKVKLSRSFSSLSATALLLAAAGLVTPAHADTTISLADLSITDLDLAATDPDTSLLTFNLPTMVTNPGETWEAFRLTYDWSQTLASGLSAGDGAFSSDTAELTLITNSPLGISNEAFGTTSRLPGTASSDGSLTSLEVFSNFSSPISGDAEFQLSAIQIDLRDSDGELPGEGETPPSGVFTFGSSEVLLNNISLELLTTPFTPPSLSSLAVGTLTQDVIAAGDNFGASDDIAGGDGPSLVGDNGPDEVWEVVITETEGYRFILDGTTSLSDQDLYVFDAAGTLLGSSASSDLIEIADVNLDPGTYYVVANVFPGGADTGGDFYDISYTFVPEPTSVALVAAGLGLIARRRRLS